MIATTPAQPPIQCVLCQHHPAPTATLRVKNCQLCGREFPMCPEQYAQAIAGIIRLAVPGLEYRLADDLLTNRCRSFIESLRMPEQGWGEAVPNG
jgi:hypothetical protein